ncbi:MAG: D-aminoacylase [Acidobacteria bacterium]|nr:D-aminoacylase [Acidobacteriota bacterium]
MLVLLVLLASTPFSLSAQEPLDVVITGGRVVDGAGNPYFFADIGIRGDAIAAIGRLASHPARLRIDASGLTVTPGFIDIHNHSIRDIFDEPTAAGFLYQGVTTLIEGPDGSSPVPLKPMLDKLSQHRMSVNMGFCIGHGSIRRAVLNMENRKPTDQELARMQEMVREGMRDGAMGLSTGLFYTPANFAQTEEVIALAKTAAEYGGFHVSHIRDEGNGILEAVKETIRIGEQGGLATQVTHHKIGGKMNRGRSAETIRLVEEARARGVDATIDQYPYTASHTSLGAALFPQWAFAGGNSALGERLEAPDTRAKIKAEIMRRIENERGGGDPSNIVFTRCGPLGNLDAGRSGDRSLEGKSLADVTRASGKEPTIANAAEMAIEIQKKGGCGAIFHWIHEEDIERILKYPHTMVASDGAIRMGHPRSYGTFARVLARYVREKKLISFEDAVRKMSGLPAQRLKLFDRGLIRPGMKADLVVLDPEKVLDQATFAKPFERAEGVRDVLVNGRLALHNGRITDGRPGRVLYGPGKADEAN